MIRCSVPNCDHPRRYIKTGYCTMHYGRFRKKGSLEKTCRITHIPGHDHSLGAAKCKICVRARYLRYRLKNKDCITNNHLVTRYGITLADRKRLLDHQKGGCAVCGKLESPNYQLHIDHDHTSGKIRGLLCKFCNMHLVFTVESKYDLIPKVLAYLQNGRLPSV